MIQYFSFVLSDFMSLSKFWLFCFLLFVGCSKSGTQKIIFEKGESFIDGKVDAKILSDVPQDLDLFVKQIAPFKQEFQDQQKNFDEAYNRIYFSPWTANYSCFRFNEEIQKRLNDFRGYGENFHKISDSEILRIKANVSDLTVVGERGILVVNALLKRLPIAHPIFKAIDAPGLFFPFDDNIGIFLNFATPIFIVATSKDQRWSFIKSHMYSGWVESEKIARVSDDFVKTFMSTPLVISVKNDNVLKNDMMFIAAAPVATILPQKDDVLLTPYKDKNGFAVFLTCHSEGFLKKPCEFNEENVRMIAGQFLNQKYGWGGSFGNRDCSMLMQDFFAVFGKYISRNSSDQLSFGDVRKLSGDRSAYIQRNARPFLTLVGQKHRHVMLYVGEYEGKPVFLHNIWSVPMNSSSRYIIGKTILSTIDFGMGIGNGIRMRSLVNTMRNI